MQTWGLLAGCDKPGMAEALFSIDAPWFCRTFVAAASCKPISHARFQCVYIASSGQEAGRVGLPRPDSAPSCGTACCDYVIGLGLIACSLASKNLAATAYGSLRIGYDRFIVPHSWTKPSMKVNIRKHKDNWRRNKWFDSFSRHQRKCPTAGGGLLHVGQAVAGIFAVHTSDYWLSYGNRPL